MAGRLNMNGAAEGLTLTNMGLATLGSWLKDHGWKGHANGKGRRAERISRFLAGDGTTLALITYDRQTGRKAIWVKGGNGTATTT